jgi:(4S)-4-hydroxy-5-phosphonooxypentane-2,3-dione isomerase
MIRIVKMEFSKEHIPDFELLFEERKEKIRNQNGCLGLTLLQDKNKPCIFFTYSHWENEDDLNKYRDSELFIDTWQTIKKWFSAKGEAWSVHEKAMLP